MRSSWNLMATSALCSIILLAACGDSGARGDHDAATAAEDRAGGTAVICSPTQPDLLNPAVTPDQRVSDLRSLLFTPLVKYGEAGDFSPYLASDWTWGDGGRELVFGIREDVRWHDGEPLTADDVAWTVRAASDPAYGFVGPAELRDLSEVEVVDAATVRLTFGRPLVTGLEPFVGLPILPRHLLENIDVSEFHTAPYHRSPVGSGPFRLQARTAEGLMVFERNELFPSDLGRPLLDRIVYRAVPEPSTMFVELQTGGVDVCVAGASLAREAGDAERLRVVAAEPFGIQVFPLDTRQPPLDDDRVRRAISAALDRTAIAASISPLARPARTLLSSNSPWLDTSFAQPDADLALADSLLTAAGWTPDGRDGIRRNEAGEALRIVAVAPRQMEAAMTVAQAQLRRAGIALDLQWMEWAAYLARVRDPANRPQAMALGWIQSRAINPDFEDDLASTGTSNFQSYRNAAVDTIFMRLQAEAAADQRRELYRDLQRHVTRDVPVVFTAYIPRLVVVGPRLQDVRVDVNGPFSSVADWWIPAAERRRR